MKAAAANKLKAIRMRARHERWRVLYESTSGVPQGVQFTIAAKNIFEVAFLRATSDRRTYQTWWPPNSQQSFYLRKCAKYRMYI